MINSPILSNNIKLDDYKKQTASKATVQVNKDVKNQQPEIVNDVFAPKNNNLKEQKAQRETTLSKIKKWLLAPSNMYANQNQSSRPTPSNLQTILSSIFQIGIMVLCFSYFRRAAKSMKFSLGTANSEKRNVWQNLNNASSLNELALPDVLKDAAQNLVYKIRNIDEYLAKGGTGKKSVLFYGPPGTGKTTFAKAIAKEFPDSRFASIDLSTMQGKYVGQTEGTLNSIVDEVCKFADENPDKKIFAFIDEIDSFAIEDKGSNNQLYHANVINALKKCISEKLNKRDNIITLAATNIDIDPEKEIENSAKVLSKPILDRFNERIKVDNPTASQFKKAIARHYIGKPMVDECLKNEGSKQVEAIAQSLEERGASFRALETLYDISASINKKDAPLTFEDVMAAIDKIGLPETSRKKHSIGFNS